MLCRIVLQFRARCTCTFERIAVSTIMKDEGWFFDYNQHLYTKVYQCPKWWGGKDRHKIQNKTKIMRKTFVKRWKSIRIGFCLNWIWINKITRFSLKKKRSEIFALWIWFFVRALALFSICHRFVVDMFHEWHHYLFVVVFFTLFQFDDKLW